MLLFWVQRLSTLRTLAKGPDGDPGRAHGPGGGGDGVRRLSGEYMVAKNQFLDQYPSELLRNSHAYAVRMN